MPSDPGFLADLRSAADAWRRHPFLLLVHIALWAAFATRFWPLTVLAMPVEVGWPGVERVWYLRAFNAGTIAPGELARLWRAFFWRFAVLGLVVLAPLVALMSALGSVITTSSQRVLVLIVFFIAMDFVLTFVTPALSFTTRRVRDALKLGLRMIRSEWPRCALYVLAPPLAIQAIFGLRRVASLGVVGSLVVSAVATVLGSASRGATAAFFLRRYPCGVDGAARLERHASLASPEPMPAPVVPGQAQEYARGRHPNVPESRMRRSRKRR